jgi:hypothetical protein
VTYPAYAGATAGVRSASDFYLLDTLMGDPDRMAAFVARLRDAGALPVGAAAEPHPVSEAAAPSPTPSLIRSDDDWMAFLQEIAP